MAAPFIVDGKDRKRPGRWIVDYRGPDGDRKWKTFKTRRAAEKYRDEMAEVLRGLTKDDAGEFDATVAGYAKHRWLKEVKAVRKPRTYESYAEMIKVHINPVFGTMRVRDLTRRRITKFLGSKLSEGLKPGTVRIIYATLRRMLSVAVRDGLLLANPAAKLGDEFGLVTSSRQRGEDIKAFTPEQLTALLDTTMRKAEAYAPLFATLAGTGTRLGEGLGLQWPDIDDAAQKIHVQRAISHGRIETPKSGHGRDVDLSEALGTMLRRIRMRRVERMKRYHWKTLPPWVFCTRSGEPLDAHNVRKVFRRCVKAAKLPRHFTPHCLRHTFASLLLQAGESPQYVQEQLGHASITLTVDTYGKWLAKKPVRGGVNILGAVVGSSFGSRSTRGVTKPLMNTGEPCGTRTHDPLIKSQVLYRLS
jgi:integrase